jgi:hypothetical protein
MNRTREEPKKASSPGTRTTVALPRAAR